MALTKEFEAYAAAQGYITFNQYDELKAQRDNLVSAAQGVLDSVRFGELVPASKRKNHIISSVQLLRAAVQQAKGGAE